jgi:hypothetical protein
MNLRASAILFAATLVLGLFVVMRSASDPGARDLSGVGSSGTSESEGASHVRFTAIKGYFLQSEEGTDDKKFDFVCSFFFVRCEGFLTVCRRSRILD